MPISGSAHQAVMRPRDRKRKPHIHQDRRAGHHLPIKAKCSAGAQAGDAAESNRQCRKCMSNVKRNQRCAAVCCPRGYLGYAPGRYLWYRRSAPRACATTARCLGSVASIPWLTWNPASMNAKLKGLIRELVPPVALRGAVALIARRHKSGNQAEQSGEKGSNWYDASFDAGGTSACHYTGSEYYFLWSVMVDRIQRTAAKSILEIACGSGQLASLIQDKAACKYIGFDFSQTRVEFARKAYPSLSFLQQDAFQTDLFTTCDYDTVVCTEFLEHVEEDTVVLNKIRKGSRFYGTVPNFGFTSHVRHFDNQDEVRSRYASYFRDLRVDKFLADVKGKAFYLLDGEIL